MTRRMQEVAKTGDENRIYPWGNDSAEPLPADYLYTDHSPFVAVGSYPGGNGRWGHADLAGSIAEWNLDYPGVYPAICTDCANLTSASLRVFRGGNRSSGASKLRAAHRGSFYADNHNNNIGFRCARNP